MNVEKSQEHISNVSGCIVEEIKNSLVNAAPGPLKRRLKVNGPAGKGKTYDHFTAGLLGENKKEKQEKPENNKYTNKKCNFERMKKTMTLSSSDRTTDGRPRFDRI